MPNHVPDPESLVHLLTEAAQILRKHGVDHWAQWLENDAAAIGRSETRAIEHLLSAFGGMGSLNDLLICPQNGHSIEASETEKVNARFAELRDAIYESARKILPESS